jgi:hypothetical protein
MSDLCMCTAKACYRSDECRRHPDSGTAVSERQAWGDFDEQRYWDADSCSGFMPLFNGMPHQAGVYGGKGLI